jgi:hypothetical protein
MTESKQVPPAIPFAQQLDDLTDREVLIGMYSLLVALTRKLTGTVPVQNIPCNGVCFTAPEALGVKFVDAKEWDAASDILEPAPLPCAFPLQ